MPPSETEIKIILSVLCKKSEKIPTSAQEILYYLWPLLFEFAPTESFLLNIEVSKGFYCTYWLGAFVYLFQLSVKRVCVCVRRTGETKTTTKPKPTPSPRAFGFSKWRRKRNLKTEMLLGTRLLRNWDFFFNQSSRVHIL